VTKSQFTQNPNGYRDTVVKQFNMLFPENELKFMRTEPAQNQFALAYPDTVLEFARSNGKTSRGHCLVWHSASQNPNWMTNRVWSTSPNRWTRNELLAIMKNHIDSVVGHNRGKILEWDVVNEGIFLSDGHPNGLRKSFWQSIIGDDYIDSAFVYAHRADPNAYLYYNEFGAEYFSSFAQAKSDSVYSLMKRLLSRGIPVHGVGFQSHASAYVGYTGLSNNIKRLGALGLRVSFTETDVSNTSNPAPLWATMVRACVDNANCTSFVSWGVDDLHSWYGKDCGCLIYDTLFQPKPTVYKAIWDELNKGRDSISTARALFASTPAHIPTEKPLVTPLITYCQNDIATALTATGLKLRWYTTSVGRTS
ncbi:MAG: endo-1,4-beta-xylanase, partial [Cytophagales bacterium]|nr:endo-1,4-beta-xylanase [Cytophagales bacterium]